MGKFYLAAARDLDFGIGDYLAGETDSHQRDVRVVLLSFRVCAELDHGRSVAVGGFGDHGTDVPAFCVLHGDRSEDDGEIEEVAVHCCVYRRVRGDVATAESRRLRAALRALYSWSRRDVDRDLAGITAPGDDIKVSSQRRKETFKNFFAPLRLCEENFHANEDSSILSVLSFPSLAADFCL